ncbi:MAG: hypothetical protein HY246_10740 [Proteobacteria bacterium]|jgi:hypothetical protein|nr:hypothetical protein [Pseudomonadota bacterium]
MTEQHRRVSDKILAAFNQACDQREFEVAEYLLRALELSLTRQGGKAKKDNREHLGPVVDAYARLEALRRPKLRQVAGD